MNFNQKLGQSIIITKVHYGIYKELLIKIIEGFVTINK